MSPPGEPKAPKRVVGACVMALVLGAGVASIAGTIFAIGTIVSFAVAFFKGGEDGASVALRFAGVAIGIAAYGIALALSGYHAGHRKTWARWTLIALYVLGAAGMSYERTPWDVWRAVPVALFFLAAFVLVTPKAHAWFTDTVAPSEPPTPPPA